MSGSISSISQPTYNAIYHNVDTRYNIDRLPPNLEPRSRVRIEQQACSVACLVEKNRLLQRNNNGSVEYSIQSPPVLTLAGEVEGDYESDYKKYCADTAQPYDHNKAKLPFRGNFADELCLGEGTAFLIGKQLLLTAAHCICDSSTRVVSRVKITSLLVLFGFQGQSPSHLFKENDVYHIDAVWNYAYKKGVADWAIVKLDREVEGRDLLTFADSPTIQFKTQLYMLGHPLGLPLKLTMGAEVKERTKSKKTDETKDGDEPSLFDADLDAFAGNSGSPVFELEKGTIIAMLFAGNTMIFKNDEKAIYVPQVSQQTIDRYGYEKCLKVASIDFLKTVLSSSFKMGHTHFVGRINLLLKLKTQLAHPSASTKVHILYGPGGVGKSELAITFANQNIEDFSFVWSISCGTDEEQRVGYQGLAQRLQISLDEKDTLHSLMNKVHRKLEQNISKPWLLLFDNLQNSPDTPTLASLPSKGGLILITSYKSPKIHSLPEDAVVSTEVLPLEMIEALKFLEAVTEKPTNDCTELLQHVGCYPLVLGQVASYIKYTGIEVEKYLINLEECQSVLAVQERPSKAPKLEAAFTMTLQQLSPTAKKWLFLCSQLNAALIPVSYLKAWLHTEGLSEEQAAVIATLEEHALLRYNAKEEVFSLHLEFQRILKILAPEDTLPQVMRLLVIAARDWNFENTTNWKETMKKATIWASHAGPLVRLAQQVPFDKVVFFNHLGQWEYLNCRYEKALRYYSQALEIMRVSLRAEHPDIATILSSIGTCYHAQGDFNEALNALHEALKINRIALEHNHPNLATILDNIGNCYSSQGKYDEALKTLSEALKIRRVALGNSHPDIAKSLSNISACYYALGNYNEALKLNGDALKILKTLFGDNHPHVATCLNNIGKCYESQGNYNEAFKIHSEALTIKKAVLGENHLDIATSLSNISTCYSFQGNYNEAIKIHSETLEIRKVVLGENHPDVATSLNNIGSCYRSQGNYNEAIKIHNEALKIRKAALKDNHPDVAMSLNHIGSCYQSLGHYNEALKVHQEALKIYKAVFGENHPEVANSLNSIGICYHSQEIYQEALKILNEALKIRRAVLGVNHSDVAASLTNIGTCYSAQGNYNEALKMHSEALEIFKAVFGENHPTVATCFNNIGCCDDSLGDYTMALVMHNEALRIKRAILGENHPDVALSLNNIGTCYHAQGRFNEAIKVFHEALRIKRALFGDNHLNVAISLTNIGSCYKAQGNYNEALKVHGEALKIYRAALGESHSNVALSLNNIGNCYVSQRNYSEALKAYQKALEIKKAILGDKHPDVAIILANIKQCQAQKQSCTVS